MLLAHGGTICPLEILALVPVISALWLSRYRLLDQLRRLFS